MRKWLRRLGYAAGGLFGLVLVAACAIYAASELRLRRTYAIPAHGLVLQPNAGAAVRGDHMVHAIGKCVECHGPNLGGRLFMDAGPLGVVYASNLTRGRGGALASYTDEQLERAIRHGVRPNGRALLVMPSDDYNRMSDADVAATIAYLRSLPPVDNTLPHSTVRLLGRLLYLKGDLPLVPAEHIDNAAPHRASQPGATKEYGEYLANVGGCTDCHGPTLAGGRVNGPPGTPPSRNLTPDSTTGVGRWTEADFVRALRQGRRPDGSRINEAMPWKLSGGMTDEEIHALWLYMRSVPARPFGQQQ
jgi:mono/diheme cytochrome c family protein